MSNWAKAIQTLQELPSNKRATVEDLQKELATYPSILVEIAVSQITYIMDTEGQELSDYGMLLEKCKHCRRYKETIEEFERAGYTIGRIS